MNCTSYSQHSPEVGCCFVVLLLRLIAPAVTSRPAPVLLKLLPLRCLPVCPALPPPPPGSWLWAAMTTRCACSAWRTARSCDPWPHRP